MPISKELLEILACPKCKGDIRLNEKGDGLICETNAAWFTKSRTTSPSCSLTRPNP